MVVIKEVDAKSILDSRGEKTIFVKIKTNVGVFDASSPTGKSTGKYEKKTYKKDLEGDIKSLKDHSDYFSEEHIEKFEDLRRVEDIIADSVGANTLFAFESAILKAIAKEKKKEVWEILDKKAKKFPRLVGNCVGGGKHSAGDKKPDFQEFELVPNIKSVKKSYETNKKIKEDIGILLLRKDKKFENKKNDENAWMTSLNDREVLDVLNKSGLPLGLDIAASSFYKRKKYTYDNPPLKRSPDEQLSYISNLIKNFNLFYVEDPFEEEDFDNFSKLLEKFPQSLIVGDDLIVTSFKKLKRAVGLKAVNAIIVKPNQCGSLLEVERVCKFAKENNVKLVFSHRSGETEETILADLAFGFGADFFKCGIEGDARVGKILRLIEIETGLGKK
jgi:enolase 1/2/3